MAKKVKSFKYFSFIEAVLAVIALIFVVMPFLVGKDNSDVSYTGLNVIFGHSVTTKIIVDVTVVYTKFSFMLFLPVIFLVAIIALALIKHFMPKLNTNLIKIIILALAVVGCIIVFMATNFLVSGDGLVKLFGQDNIKNSLKIGIGAILQGITFIIIGLTAAADIALSK